MSNSCGTPKEVDRYAFLVDAGNAAFSLLKPIKHDGIRGANDELQILFHRNDPKEIHGQHGTPYFTSDRKPDILITSLAAALRAAGIHSNQSWKEVTKSYAPYKPNEAFEWFDSLSSLELKLLKGFLVPPPKMYGTMPSPIPHENNIYNHFNPKKRHAEPFHIGSGSSAKRVKTVGMSICYMSSAQLTIPDTDPPRSSSRLRQEVEVPQTSTPPANSERTAASVVSTPFDDGDKAPPIVQSALYGTETLCGSLGASNSVNLFIKGMLIQLLVLITLKTFTLSQTT
jgi:hypothetical protein